MLQEATLLDQGNSTDVLVPFFLWIDGVGSYLVLMSHRLTMGQANPEMPLDIAVLADVSRHHATLQRDGETYFLEAIRPVSVNGKTTNRSFLRSGDRFTLGASCQFQFWQEVPTSTSACVDLVSGHRFARPVQSVLLMSETLVMGPTPQSHVTIPDLTDTVVLHRSKTGVAIRVTGRVNVDGVWHTEKAPLHAKACVFTDQLTFALEPLTRER